MAGSFTVVERPITRDIMNYLMMTASDADKKKAREQEQQRIGISRDALGLEKQKLGLEEAQNKRSETYVTAQIKQWQEENKRANRTALLEAQRQKATGALTAAQLEEIKTATKLNQQKADAFATMSPKELAAYLSLGETIQAQRAQIGAAAQEAQLYRTQLGILEERRATEISGIKELVNAATGDVNSSQEFVKILGESGGDFSSILTGNNIARIVGAKQMDMENSAQMQSPVMKSVEEYVKNDPPGTQYSDKFRQAASSSITRGIPLPSTVIDVPSGGLIAGAKRLLGSGPVTPQRMLLEEAQALDAEETKKTGVKSTAYQDAWIVSYKVEAQQEAVRNATQGKANAGKASAPASGGVTINIPGANTNDMLKQTQRK